MKHPLPLIKIVSYFLFAIPVTILLVFFIGETFSGVRGGFIHLLQLLPLLLLLYLTYKNEHLGALLLLESAVVLAFLYGITMPINPFLQFLFIESILFLPVIVGGLLLLTRRKRRIYF